MPEKPQGPSPRPSFVVTGGGDGVGATIAEHLAEIGHVVSLDPAAGRGRPPSVHPFVGDAGLETAGTEEIARLIHLFSPAA